MPRVGSLALLALLQAGHCGAAAAHAFLEHASPPVGATVRAAPTEVALDFTEAVEPAFSSIVVQDAQARRVDRGDDRVAPGNPKRLVVSLPAASPPGVYSVTWQVTSVDTHQTTGRFSFTVAP